MDLALDLSGQPTVPDRELVGMHVVEAKPEALGDSPGETRETTRDDGDAKAVTVEGR